MSVSKWAAERAAGKVVYLAAMLVNELAAEMAAEKAVCWVA